MLSSLIRLTAALAAPCAAASAVGQPEQPTPPEQLVPWPAAVRDFSTPEQLLRVAETFPHSGGMQRRRLAAAIRAGDAATALDALRRLAAMGAVLSAGALAQAEKLVGEAAMTSLRGQFDANAAPLTRSRVYARVPAEHDLVEGIAWSPKLKRLYVTSVVDGSLVEIGKAKAEVARLTGVGSLFGAAFDASGRLWLAAGAVEQTPKGKPPFVGLVRFDPAAPSALRRVAALAGAAPGDVAAARDGTLYASDGMNGAIYRCVPGCSSLETYLRPGTLFSAQGLALSADQKLLYIADRRYGIAIVERASGRLFQLTGGRQAMLDGIDGLAFHAGALIGTQTAYSPARIIRIRLSQDGYRAASVEVLERAHPEWGEVTLGTVRNGEYLYVADAQWGRYGRHGAPVADKPAKATEIRALSLR